MHWSRRVLVENRRRRLHNRRHVAERRQVERQAAQEINDPIARGADQPELHGQDQIIEDMPIQLPAPHSLGDMNNRCPHCASRSFKEERTTQGVFTKCCFQGKVTLPPVQLPPQIIVDLFSGETAVHVTSWTTYATTMLHLQWLLGMQH